MTSEQPPAQDKLAEIEQTIAEFGGGGEGTFIRWLIDEVKRLRGLGNAACADLDTAVPDARLKAAADRATPKLHD
jgi:hypothetical protein